MLFESIESNGEILYSFFAYFWNKILGDITNMTDKEISNFIAEFHESEEEYLRTEAKFKKIRDAEVEIFKNIRIPIKQEELGDGEYLCDLCKGMKACYSNKELIARCPACNGKGKTDWIENIYGKVNSYEW